MTPAKQHAKAAERILKRRAKNLNNDSEPSLPKAVLDAPEDGTRTDPAGVDAVVTDKTEEVPEFDEMESPYEEMTIKQLRKLCDARNPKVEYKKKNTKPELIELLKDI